MYKLVANDIDGTLHDDKGNLSDKNLLAGGCMFWIIPLIIY